MPTKLVTHSMKLRCLAYSKSKYVLNVEVYIGKTNEAILKLLKQVCSFVVAVVFCLIVVSEHTSAIGNFFTLPMLFEDLKSRVFYVVGIARHG